MNGFWLTVYILMILTVIFLERKSPTEALLWVLVLVCIPYAGILLYLVFGSTMAIKVTAYARRKRLKKCCPDAALPEPVSTEHWALSEEDRQVIQFNGTYNHSRLTSFDESCIYIDGESHYRQLFKDIAEAKQCIYVEFYTIQRDSVGEKFVQALVKKAREGVQVLVMCDFIANISTPEKMFRPLKEAGGEVIRVKPYLTHYRSHRKIVGIDHRIAYIGGMNIGNQYANLAKHKNPWRDTQVRLTGACVRVLDAYFMMDRLCSVPRRRWDEAVRDLGTLPQKSAKPTNANLCQFIVGGVDTDKESVKMCYLSMIRCAKKRIRIQTPYFIPDASILDALKTAAAAGVEIELMIPGIKASFFLDPVTTYYCGQLLQYGAKVYKYNGYIHAKTMIVDDELCCIGSVNMDMRSLMIDDEVCGVFYVNAMVSQYQRIYDRDICSCKEYLHEEFENRNLKERIMEGIFLIFAPLM